MTRPIDLEKLTWNYNTANSRLILFDYDGTLVPFEVHPRLTKPDVHVISLLNTIAADRRNHVILISGRDKEHLEASLSNLPIVLVAEHGAYYRNPGNVWRAMFSISGEWTQKALPALKALAFQYDGSFLEHKTYSLAWHYRAIAGKITESDKRQILAAIRSLPEHEHFLVYDAEFTIELRTPGIDKGSFVARWVGNRNYDFVMAIGDGHTDEDLFKIFGKESYTIKVGKSDNSAANFHIRSQDDVLPFIHKLLNLGREFDKKVKVDLQKYRLDGNTRKDI